MRHSIRCCLAASVLLVPLAAPISLAAAQVRPAADSVRRATARRDSLSPDSIAARLARAEAAIAILRQQLGEQSESAVRTSSRFQIELNGRVLTNGFSTYGRVNNLDVPQFALEAGSYGAGNDDALGIVIRQSRLGAILSVSSVLGATFESDVDLDFFGGEQTGPGGRRLFPEIRLRTARARLRWARTELMVGSTTPLISDLNPVSVAAVGVPGFAAAGNLWNWLPQVRATHDIATAAVGQTPVTFALQGAVLEPFAGSQYAGGTDATDAGERSGRPYLEARLRARWGDVEFPFPLDAGMGGGGGEIGVSVHRGWVALGYGELTASRAVAFDGRVSLTPRIELRGEAYTGRLVRGLGGGAIGQGFGLVRPGESRGPPVHNVAGWAQLNVQSSLLAVTGVGCGIDVADEDDRPVRRRNAVCALHVLWRPAQPLLIGAEYRQLRTRYAEGLSRANHFNLAFGVEF